MWFRLNLFLFFIVLLIQIHAKPFLKNTVQTISSSIASASSDTNISDLRKRSDKLLQLSKYQNEDDDWFLSEDADDEAKAVDAQENNEALPNFIQKKIAKIMRKLQFIAGVINSFTGNGGDDDNDDDKEEKDPDFDSDFDSVNSGNSTSKPSLEINDLEGQEQIEFDERISVIPGNKYEPTVGGVGVYFMELLGSLFGLVYGAAIQLANSMNPKPSE